MSKTEAYVPAPKEATLLKPRPDNSAASRSRSINVADLSFTRNHEQYQARATAVFGNAAEAEKDQDGPEEEEFKYEENLTRFGIVNRSSYASSRFSASVHLSDTMTSNDLYNFLNEDKQNDEEENKIEEQV